MVRPVILLQFLLVLVVAINVLFACKCGTKFTMEQAICNGQTLMMATAQRMELTDAFFRPVTNEDDAYLTLYKMQLNVMYHEGNKKLSIANGNFDMVTPMREEDCGVKFELNTDYFIAGSPWNGTLLLVLSCGYVEPVPWLEKTPEELEQINDLLTLQTQVDCSKLCKVVTDFGVTLPCE